MQMITDARANATVDALYTKIEGLTPIHVIPSSDLTWSSETKGGTTTIEFADTINPAESLYHELLHADLKTGGYLQYNLVNWGHNPLAQKVSGLLTALDNELQHHRIYSTFIGAGFDGASSIAMTTSTHFEYSAGSSTSLLQQII